MRGMPQGKKCYGRATDPVKALSGARRYRKGRVLYYRQLTGLDGDRCPIMDEGVFWTWREKKEGADDVESACCVV